MSEIRHLENLSSRLQTLTSELNALSTLLVHGEDRQLRVDVLKRLKELQTKFELAQGRLQRLQKGRSGRLLDAQNGFRRAWAQLQANCDGVELRVH